MPRAMVSSHQQNLAFYGKSEGYALQYCRLKLSRKIKRKRPTDNRETFLLIPTTFLWNIMKDFHFKEKDFKTQPLYGLFFSILTENSRAVVKLYSLEVNLLTFCPINSSFLIFGFALKFFQIVQVLMEAISLTFVHVHH